MRANIEDLRAFVQVAEAESFHQAADELCITQSALSRRLQKLEQVLGARLLDRTSRSVGLTAVGEAFLPSARRVIRHMERALTDIRDFVDLRGGTVSMASTRTVASTVLPRALARYNAEFPGMKVRVLDGIGTGTARFVLSGEAEFGVVLADNEPADLDVMPILEDPYVLACHEDHPLAARSEIKWSDLAGHRFLGMGTGTGNERVLSRELEASGLLPDWVIEAQHLSTVMAFIEANLGISAVPRITIERFRGARIVTRPLIDPVVRRRIGILEAPDRELSPAALELRRIVVEELERFGHVDPAKADQIAEEATV
ncbi:MAG: LysR family transcriptional regulator [Gammaproteobacteria bacterium]|nr:LysR family transcriptional regulator [Gammaproteobacteria bacterium]